jgi:hypothetical protein
MSADETGLLPSAAEAVLGSGALRRIGGSTEPSTPPTPRTEPAQTPSQQEYLRRAEELDTEQGLALIKEMFLPPGASAS